MQNVKDYYGILGVLPNAKLDAIKTAYKQRAKMWHPDKPEGNQEKMQDLVEAIGVLSNADKRRTYDSTREEEGAPSIHPRSYLDAHAEPHSHRFRKRHAEQVAQFKAFSEEELKHQFQTLSLQTFFSPLEEEVKGEARRPAIRDLYAFIHEAQAHNPEPLGQLANLTLEDLAKTLKVFKKFLNKGYTKKSTIDAIQRGFSTKKKALQKTDPGSYEISLFEGILAILAMSKKGKAEHAKLVFAFQKITDYAKQAPDMAFSLLVPLFDDPGFRQLYAYALSQHCQAKDKLFSFERLKQYDGRAIYQEKIFQLRQRLFQDPSNEEHKANLSALNLLFQFEKDLYKLGQEDGLPSDYRELAFHCLDWCPVLTKQGSPYINAHLFLQIAIKFQQASQVETNLAQKIADEKLALDMYMTANEIARKVTPTFELYIARQSIQYLSALEHQDPMLSEWLPELIRRALYLADFYPFFEAPQSLIELLLQKDHMLQLLSKFLRTMVNICQKLPLDETAKEAQKLMEQSQPPSRVFYEAYAASVNQYYEKKQDANTTAGLRLSLMEALVANKAWTFFDVERPMCGTAWSLAYNKDLWLQDMAILPFSQTEESFSLIHGASIDKNTGIVNFHLEKNGQDAPLYEQLFTRGDLKQILEQGLSWALFSLDPVSADMPYHPFNKLRFAPENLQNTHFLLTMLRADVLLKFLVSGQEVQLNYPFEQRPLGPMLKELPDYLKKIIKNYQKTQKTGAAHRFWIEAEVLEMALEEKDLPYEKTIRILLNNLKMVVKKHRMKRDAEGKLVDCDEAEEGWPIYVLGQEMPKIETLPERAFMLIDDTPPRFRSFENHEFSVEKPIDSLPMQAIVKRLLLLKRNEAGKIIQNTENMPLIFHATKKIAKFFQLPHYCSPELIFSQKITEHYEELGMYFPILLRLRELSKMLGLVRIFQDMRENNLQSLEEARKRQVASLPTPEYTRLGAEQYYRKKVEEGFKSIGLAKAPAVAWNQQCFWVAGSHKQARLKTKDKPGKLVYGTFFTFGGVNVQSEIRNVQNGNWANLGIINAMAGSAVSSTELAREALNAKLQILKYAQETAARTVREGNITFYYGQERPASKPGLPTRGAAYVTAHNSATGDVWNYMECYNRLGEANRVHPKGFNGVPCPDAHHVPKTQKECLQESTRPK